MGQIVLVPMDITKLTMEQKDDAFKAWAGGLVMDQIKAAGHKAVLQFIAKGDAGPAAGEYQIQGARVWFEGLAVDQLIPFNAFLDQDIPNASHPEVMRNNPKWFAANLFESAVYWDKQSKAGNLGEMEIHPQPVGAEVDVAV